ncbi:MAG TPA: ATP-binding protein [Flavisolibacter sp.]|nr:ATP-binding protein [Flavisolibacter sp.]
MAEENKKRLHLTTIIYWVLLLYIVAALVWWFLSLYVQAGEMFELRKSNLEASYGAGSAVFREKLLEIEDEWQTDKAKYIGEGITFFVLILIGAVFLYRSVRRQFRAQRQQQNFVMAITHELKTPISVARLNLETLLRHSLEEQKKEKILQMTLHETMRLDSLINNILISSQLDGRSYQMSKEELNFSDLVQAASSQFTSRYPERKLFADIQPDIDLNGDPLLLKLLVSNLLENANKYSPRNRPVQLKLDTSRTGIVLTVKDEGCGIDNTEKKNVFNKFYRIGNEQTRTTQGTGLGLYLCKKIVEDHGGRIVIEDNQPQGSIFIIGFPA